MMDAKEASAAAARLRLAIEMFEVGESMKRQSLRRENPQASDAEIERMLVAWLHHRPGAEHGDAEGVPGTWPRTS